MNLKFRPGRKCGPGLTYCTNQTKPNQAKPNLTKPEQTIYIYITYTYTYAFTISVQVALRISSGLTVNR